MSSKAELPPPPTAPELLAACADGGFSPGKRHLGGLLELLEFAGKDEAAPVERALGRACIDHAPALGRAYPDLPARARARLLRVFAKAYRQVDPSIADSLFLAGLVDSDAQVERQAIVAVGRVQLQAARQLLLDKLRALENSDEITMHDDAKRRALIESLGKLGGNDVVELLQTLDLSKADPHALRLHGRAQLMAERTELREGREAPTQLIGAWPDNTLIRLRCREGLVPVVLEEIEDLHRSARFELREQGLDYVEGYWRGEAAAIAQLRTIQDVALRVALLPGQSLDERVISTIVACEPLFLSWDAAPARYRLSLRGAGHQRSWTWQIIEQIRSRTDQLINDPSQAPWDVVVDGDYLELGIRGLLSARFDYRVADVPAASHPTIAAALARVAWPREGDVIWDPFVGSGQELIEAARLAPGLSLWGTDIEQSALAAATANCERAQVKTNLRLQDAREFREARPNLIISNPPMGRRVHAHGDLAFFLCQVLTQGSRILQPGGKVVWLSPCPQQTQACAHRLGLRTRVLGRIDLGGFSAELEIHEKAQRRSR